MRTKEYRGRTYDAASTVVSAGVFRGVFDVGSTSPSVTDGVINEATEGTFPTRKEAKEAAAAAAQQWIDSESGQGLTLGRETRGVHDTQRPNA